MAKSETRYYVLVVVQDLEPELYGPYATEQARDEAAKEFKRKDEEQENGIYHLTIDAHGMPVVGAYSGGFLSGDFKAAYDAKGRFKRIVEVSPKLRTEDA